MCGEGEVDGVAMAAACEDEDVFHGGWLYGLEVEEEEGAVLPGF